MNPSTPSRPRVLPPHLRPSTPSSNRKPQASASPQVKEALAALRRQRAAQASLKPCTSSGGSTPTSENVDPFSTPARRAPSSRASSALSQTTETAIEPGPDSVPEERREVEDDEERDERLAREWGIKSSLEVIELARKAGRLNLSSRELRRIPPALWSLLPRSSLHHPSHAAPSSSRAAVNLTIGGADGEGREGTYWYDEVDLKMLSLSNNELAEVGAEIGDFDVLDSLDLHANLLKTVPPSLCGLTTLSTLNLSQNSLAEFPLVLLSLHSLRELNLGSCSLTHLWPTEWRVELDELLRPTGPSPSATPESANASRDFIELFPSSPTKATAQRFEPPVRTNAPWPRLRVLELRDNPLDWTGLRRVEWPANLVELDLSACGLRDEALEPEKLGKLARLEKLDLAKNYLADQLFAHPALELAEDEDDERPAFGALKSLELELNAIDSCASVENWLERRVRRPLEWSGVEKKVQNLIASARNLPGAVHHEGETLLVKVSDNPLREEQVRRRAMFPPRTASATSSPALGPPDAMSPAPSPRLDQEGVFELKRDRVKEQWELDAEAGLLTEGGRRKARILAARKAEEEAKRREEAEQALSNGMAKMVFAPTAGPPVAAPVAATAVPTATPTPAPAVVGPADTTNDEMLKTDPAVKLIKSCLSTRSPSLALAHKSLDELPTPASVPSSALVPPPQTVDLSHNALSSTPFAELSLAWGWSSTLRTLDLSFNSIAAVQVLESAVELSGLRDLNLSQNRFRGDAAELFERLAQVAPGLETLDLSRNGLTDLTNLPKLLLPASPRKGLKSLLLRNNKLSSLTPLANLADHLHSTPSDLTRWRCELVDIQENEVARLEPLLGRLPGEVRLLVGGNRFRVPRREVYEAGGGRELLAWLRERI